MSQIIPADKASHSLQAADPSIVTDAQAGEQTIDIVEYWRSITQRKWIILGLAAAIALVTTLVVFSLRPVYRGAVTLLIEAGHAKVVSIEEVYSGASQNHEYFQTQVEILKSRELAKKVVEKTKLAEHPDYDLDKQSGISLRWLMPTSWFGEKAESAEDTKVAAATRRLMNDLEVLPVHDSQLVKVAFEAYDKELAARIPNVLVETYIDMDLEAKLQMTQKASGWLTERLGGLRKQLEASEQALQQYREREHIVDVKDVPLSGASLQLGELTSRLVAARQHRAEAETAFEQVQAAKRTGTGLDSIPAILRNPQVAHVKDVENDLARKVSELGQRYGREHPKMVAADADLKAAKANTARQIEQAVVSVTHEYDAARSDEQALQRALSQSRGDIQSINRSEFALGALQRDVDSNKQLYDMFLSRYKQTDVAGDMQSTVARVIDPAIVPGGPAKPQKLRIVSIAFVLGLFIGVLMALLLDRLDNTFKTSADVEKRLGMPLVGVVQYVKLEANIKASRIFLDDPKSAFSEAVRTIRTGVMLSGLDDPRKVLMVTSSVPQEGKSTVAMNLAFAIGHLKPVLLIDADMRRPSIGKALGLESAMPGLSNYVAGTSTISQCMVPVPGTNVHVMPAGVIPPNPLELLWSKRFADVLAHLSSTFEYIIIDTPPVQLVSDAFIIAKQVNEVIYVAKADDTPYQVARTGIRRLQSMNAHVLGVVLNQLDIQKAERYYGEYGYRYGYTYYGESKDDQKKKARDAAKNRAAA